MLLAILLVLHGDGVKDHLPHKIEAIRQLARIRLLVCGVRRGMTREEVQAVLGPCTHGVYLGTNNLREVYPSGVSISYYGKAAKVGPYVLCVLDIYTPSWHQALVLNPR
jgi:hypothetical protein